MSWTPIPDTQTPNWTGIVPFQYVGPFQVGAFQTDFQPTSVPNPWTPVNDAQTPVWVPVA